MPFLAVITPTDSKPCCAVIIPTESIFVTSKYVNVPPIETLPLKSALPFTSKPVHVTTPALNPPPPVPAVTKLPFNFISPTTSNATVGVEL